MRYDPRLTIRKEKGYLDDNCPATFEQFVCTLEVGHESPHAAYGFPTEPPFVVWTNDAYRRPHEDGEATR